MTYLFSYGQMWIFPKILKLDRTTVLKIAELTQLMITEKLSKAVLKYYKSLYWLPVKHVEIFTYILGFKSFVFLKRSVFG